MFLAIELGSLLFSHHILLYYLCPPDRDREQQDGRFGGASQAPSGSGSWGGASARHGYPSVSYTTPRCVMPKIHVQGCIREPAG